MFNKVLKSIIYNRSKIFKFWSKLELKKISTVLFIFFFLGYSLTGFRRISSLNNFILYLLRVYFVGNQPFIVMNPKTKKYFYISSIVAHSMNQILNIDHFLIDSNPVYIMIFTILLNLYSSLNTVLYWSGVLESFFLNIGALFSSYLYYFGQVDAMIFQYRYSVIAIFVTLISFLLINY